jgi:hypothetical protein
MPRRPAPSSPELAFAFVAHKGRIGCGIMPCVTKLSFLEGLDEELARLQVVDGPPSGAISAGDGSFEAPKGRQLSELEIAEDRLRGVENDLFEASLQVSADMLAFCEIEPGEKNVPQPWIEKYGLERAQKRLRVAQASWSSGKDAPVALKHAALLAVGIIRSRAAEKAAPRQLNIVMVELTEQPQHGFRELEVGK